MSLAGTELLLSTMPYIQVAELHRDDILALEDANSSDPLLPLEDAWSSTQSQHVVNLGWTS